MRCFTCLSQPALKNRYIVQISPVPNMATLSARSCNTWLRTDWPIQQTHFGKHINTTESYCRTSLTRSKARDASPQPDRPAQPGVHW